MTMILIGLFEDLCTDKFEKTVESQEENIVPNSSTTSSTESKNSVTEEAMDELLSAAADYAFSQESSV